MASRPILPKKDGLSAVGEARNPVVNELTAFQLFCFTHRYQLRDRMPHLDATQTSHKLVEIWSEMSSSTRALYHSASQNQGRNLILANTGQGLSSASNPRRIAPAPTSAEGMKLVLASPAQISRGRTIVSPLLYGPSTVRFPVMSSCIQNQSYAIMGPTPQPSSLGLHQPIGHGVASSCAVPAIVLAVSGSPVVHLPNTACSAPLLSPTKGSILAHVPSTVSTDPGLSPEGTGSVQNRSFQIPTPKARKSRRLNVEKTLVLDSAPSSYQLPVERPEVLDSTLRPNRFLYTYTQWSPTSRYMSGIREFAFGNDVSPSDLSVPVVSRELPTTKVQGSPASWSHTAMKKRPDNGPTVPHDTGLRKTSQVIYKVKNPSAKLDTVQHDTGYMSQRLRHEMKRKLDNETRPPGFIPIREDVSCDNSSSGMNTPEPLISMSPPRTSTRDIAKSDKRPDNTIVGDVKVEIDEYVDVACSQSQPVCVTESSTQLKIPVDDAEAMVTEEDNVLVIDDSSFDHNETVNSNQNSNRGTSEEPEHECSVNEQPWPSDVFDKVRQMSGELPTAKVSHAFQPLPSKQKRPDIRPTRRKDISRRKTGQTVYKGKNKPCKLGYVQADKVFMSQRLRHALKRKLDGDMIPTGLIPMSGHATCGNRSSETNKPEPFIPMPPPRTFSRNSANTDRRPEHTIVGDDKVETDGQVCITCGRSQSVCATESSTCSACDSKEGHSQVKIPLYDTEALMTKADNVLVIDDSSFSDDNKTVYSNQSYTHGTSKDEQECSVNGQPWLSNVVDKADQLIGELPTAKVQASPASRSLPDIQERQYNEPSMPYDIDRRKTCKTMDTVKDTSAKMNMVQSFKSNLSQRIRRELNVDTRPTGLIPISGHATCGNRSSETNSSEPLIPMPSPRTIFRNIAKPDRRPEHTNVGDVKEGTDEHAGVTCSQSQSVCSTELRTTSTCDSEKLRPWLEEQVDDAGNVLDISSCEDNESEDSNQINHQGTSGQLEQECSGTSQPMPFNVVDKVDQASEGNTTKTMTDYVMIPCEVTVAEMLGWDASSLPRASKSLIERLKVTAKTASSTKETDEVHDIDQQNVTEREGRRKPVNRKRDLFCPQGTGSVSVADREAAKISTIQRDANTYRGSKGGDKYAMLDKEDNHDNCSDRKSICPILKTEPLCAMPDKGHNYIVLNKGDDNSGSNKAHNFVVFEKGDNNSVSPMGHNYLVLDEGDNYSVSNNEHKYVVLKKFSGKGGNYIGTSVEDRPTDTDKEKRDGGRADRGLHPKGDKHAPIVKMEPID